MITAAPLETAVDALVDVDPRGGVVRRRHVYVGLLCGWGCTSLLGPVGAAWTASVVEGVGIGSAIPWGAAALACAFVAGLAVTFRAGDPTPAEAARGGAVSGAIVGLVAGTTALLGPATIAAAAPILRLATSGRIGSDAFYAALCDSIAAVALAGIGVLLVAAGVGAALGSAGGRIAVAAGLGRGGSSPRALDPWGTGAAALWLLPTAASLAVEVCWSCANLVVAMATNAWHTQRVVSWVEVCVVVLWFVAYDLAALSIAPRAAGAVKLAWRARGSSRGRAGVMLLGFTSAVACFFAATPSRWALRGSVPGETVIALAIGLLLSRRSGRCCESTPFAIVDALALYAVVVWPFVALPLYFGIGTGLGPTQTIVALSGTGPPVGPEAFEVLATGIANAPLWLEHVDVFLSAVLCFLPLATFDAWHAQQRARETAPTSDRP